jgi:hypothetical protein
VVGLLIQLPLLEHTGCFGFNPLSLPPPHHHSFTPTSCYHYIHILPLVVLVVLVVRVVRVVVRVVVLELYLYRTTCLDCCYLALSRLCSYSFVCSFACSLSLRWRSRTTTTTAALLLLLPLHACWNCRANIHRPRYTACCFRQGQQDP